MVAADGSCWAAAAPHHPHPLPLPRSFLPGSPHSKASPLRLSNRPICHLTKDGFWKRISAATIEWLAEAGERQARLVALCSIVDSPLPAGR